MIGEIEKNMLVRDINQVLDKYQITGGLFSILINDELIQFAITKGNDQSKNEFILQTAQQLNAIMQQKRKEQISKPINLC